MKKKIMMIVLVICLLLVPITMFSGCGIPKAETRQIDYILVDEGGASSWVRYYNVKEYYLADQDIIVIKLTTGEQIITSMENVVIKLKGE